MNCLENIMKFGEKSAITSKHDLIVSLYTIKNILKLKENLIMEKLTQIFTIIKYQKKLVNRDQRIGKNYYLQMFLEGCKYVVQEKKIPEYITVNQFLKHIKS